MPASRVESESKPEPKRWESDDYKADLTAHPEEIKDLCPIVITTIDCRATDTAGKYEFDKNIEGDENNDYAHFFTNVGVARKVDPKGKLCEKYCDEWNQELSFFGRRLGHNYQTTDKALEYYRLEMKNNCDNKC